MKARSKRMTVAIWALSALMAALYVHTGTKKIVPDLRGSQDTTVAHFRAWGYSDTFRIFIGWAEVSGAVGLLLPPVATAAAMGLVPIMVGAAYNHIVHEEGVAAAMIPITVMALLFFVGYQRRSDFLQLPHHAARGLGRTRAEAS